MWWTVLCLLAGIGSVRAAAGDDTLCRAAVATAEAGTSIPGHLLSAIAVVESGRRNPGNGLVSPWPWTINVEGVGHLYESKAEAIGAVQEFQARGARSIDVGCMQINLRHHPNAFASLDQAFDPVSNARYAARFLLQLYGQAGTWPKAAAAYHSWTPELGDGYARKVLAIWETERDLPATAPAPSHALSPFAATSMNSGAGPGLGHILPMAGGATTAIGRGLDDYRAAPTRLSLSGSLLRRF